MSVADIPAGLALCRAAGWNQLAHDWEAFLQLSPEGCLVCTDGHGKVVGTVTTVSYENHFSWIGMVLVDPAKRRQGIGMQLLQEALVVLSDATLVKLDATPAGREVYLKLDFEEEYSISRMQVMSAPEHAMGHSAARPVVRKDLPELIQLDREVFGANRLPLLELILKAAPEFAFVTEGERGINGYCFGRRGHNFSHIGPVIARDIATAKSTFSAVLHNCKGPVITDALHHTPEWISWLSSIGFSEQRKLTRMFRGNNVYPGFPEKQFSILGPEFG